MSDSDDAAPAAGQLVPPAVVPDRGYSSLYLPEFWPETPDAWFLHAESKFRLKHITSEWDCYDHLVGALPRASVRLVLDLLENPDEQAPYSALNDKLLSSHELTNFERIEKLFQMEPLGGRKPTELLSEMLELCTRGQEYVFPVFVPAAASSGAARPSRRGRHLDTAPAGRQAVGEAFPPARHCRRRGRRGGPPRRRGPVR